MAAADPGTAGCRGCQATVRLAAGEVERLLRAYLADRPEPLAEAACTARRLAVCAGCPDLLYGNTCRHCGCLVAIRARLAGKRCPAPADRWHGLDEPGLAS